MVLKITRYVQAFPGHGLDQNRKRCHRFANAGIEYLRVCAAAATSRDSYGWNFHAEFPLMHQAIELLIKAHAAWKDDDFDPRQFSHRTSEIIRSYEDKIPIFKLISSNPEQMALLQGLEEAWLSLRYADSVVESTGGDMELAGQIANRLADEYYKQTGVRLQSHHFENKDK